VPYKPEYKATPYFSNEKIGQTSYFAKLNKEFSSDGWEQKELNIILLRNNKLKK
jgi:hypothetical protein